MAKDRLMLLVTIVTAEAGLFVAAIQQGPQGAVALVMILLIVVGIGCLGIWAFSQMPDTIASPVREHQLLEPEQLSRTAVGPRLIQATDIRPTWDLPTPPTGSPGLDQQPVSNPDDRSQSLLEHPKHRFEWLDLPAVTTSGSRTTVSLGQPLAPIQHLPAEMEQPVRARPREHDRKRSVSLAPAKVSIPTTNVHEPRGFFAMIGDGVGMVVVTVLAILAILSPCLLLGFLLYNTFWDI